MATGYIRRAMIDKGYGFIGVQGGADCYFHHTQLRDCAFDEQLEGRRVEFDMTTGRDGRFRAENVKPLN